MAENQEKFNSINFIGRDLEMRENISEEKDWYILLNVLVICVMVAITLLSYLFKVNYQAQTNAKRKELITKINDEINKSEKFEIQSKISSLDQKLATYKDFKELNFDFNQFYKETTKLYKDKVKVNKISAGPGQSTISLEIELKDNGYRELPEFIAALNSDTRFKGAVISSVSFKYPNQDQKLVEHLNETDKFIAIIELATPSLTREQIATAKYNELKRRGTITNEDDLGKLNKLAVDLGKVSIEDLDNMLTDPTYKTKVIEKL